MLAWDQMQVRDMNVLITHANDAIACRAEIKSGVRKIVASSYARTKRPKISFSGGSYQKLDGGGYQISMNTISCTWLYTGDNKTFLMCHVKDGRFGQTQWPVLY